MKEEKNTTASKNTVPDKQETKKLKKESGYKEDIEGQVKEGRKRANPKK